MAKRRVCGVRLWRRVGGSIEELSELSMARSDGSTRRACLLRQWHRNFARYPPRLRCGYLHQSVRSGREQLLAIFAEAEATTASLVAARAPFCFDTAAAGLMGGSWIRWG